jgi:hypothetical protein
MCKSMVSAVVTRGAWESWLLTTSGFKPLLDGLVQLGDVPAPAIVQGHFSLDAELLEPAVGVDRLVCNPERQAASCQKRPSCMRVIIRFLAAYRCSSFMMLSCLTPCLEGRLSVSLLLVYIYPACFLDAWVRPGCGTTIT